MSYIGKKPSDITRAIATNDTFTGDGSTTTFTLSQGAASANDLTVVVNNVRQEPGTGSKSYTLTAPTSLIFNTAPAASDEIYVIKENLLFLENTFKDTKLEFDYLSSSEKLLEYQKQFFENSLQKKSLQELKALEILESKLKISDLTIFDKNEQ